MTDINKKQTRATFHVLGTDPHIIKEITHFENGKPRARPVYERNGKRYKTLKAARAARPVSMKDVVQ
jgi:hypothetical protein